MALETWFVYFVIRSGPHSFSRLCLRCRDLGVIVPADDASPDSCRGHLAEDRVNILIGAEDRRG